MRPGEVRLIVLSAYWEDQAQYSIWKKEGIHI